MPTEDKVQSRVCYRNVEKEIPLFGHTHTLPAPRSMPYRQGLWFFMELWTNDRR